MVAKHYSALLILLALLPGVHAQYAYTLHSQTNTINITSNWVGNGSYVVGSNTSGNALLIQDGGVLSNGNGYIGYTTDGSNNSVRISGTGSVWIISGGLVIGGNSSDNSLVISNGGELTLNGGLVIGGGAGRTNSGITITGSSGNTLTISNGGVLTVSGGLVIGGGAGATNNSITITGGELTVSNATIRIGAP